MERIKRREEQLPHLLHWIDDKPVDCGLGEEGAVRSLER